MGNYVITTIPVNVKQLDCTKAEMKFVKKYLRLRRNDGRFQPVFTIGCQSFDFGYLATKKVASWYCLMMAKALITLLDEEYVQEMS